MTRVPSKHIDSQFNYHEDENRRTIVQHTILATYFKLEIVIDLRLEIGDIGAFSVVS